jgi:hypothetical protein
MSADAVKPPADAVKPPAGAVKAAERATIGQAPIRRDSFG